MKIRDRKMRKHHNQLRRRAMGAFEVARSKQSARDRKVEYIKRLYDAFGQPPVNMPVCECVRPCLNCHCESGGQHLPAPESVVQFGAVPDEQFQVPAPTPAKTAPVIDTTKQGWFDRLTKRFQKGIAAFLERFAPERNHASWHHAD